MGSVYVLSNLSLDGQLKVGFTLNSVGERLRKLNSSTSIPTKFVVEYYVELEDSETYKIEQAAHSELRRRGHHHGKEFFRCTVDDCKNAIAKAIASHNAIVLHAEDAKITRAEVAREKERIQAEQAQLTRATELERKLIEAEQAIKDRYQVELDRITDPGRYLHWWFGFSAVFAMLIAWGSVKGFSGGGFVSACLGGAVAAFFARNYDESDKRQGSEYLIKSRERDAEIAIIRTKPTSFKPSLGATKSNFQFGNQEMRGPIHRRPSVPAEGLPATASWPKSSISISERTNRAVHGRSALSEPTNKASQSKSNQSANEEMREPVSASVASYIKNKNRQEVEKLSGYFTSQVPLEHTQTQRTTWANVGQAFSLQEVEVWGQDLAECVGRQQSRTHWKLQRKLNDVLFLQTTASASNIEFFNAFGSELVDFCALVSEKYIQAFGLEFDSLFSENVSTKEDVDNFGEDLVQMIDLVAAGMFARSRLTTLGLKLPNIPEEEQKPHRATLMLPDETIDVIALREFAGSLSAQTEDRRDVRGGLWVLEQKFEDCDSENEKERKLKRHDEFTEVLGAAGFKWSKVRHGWFVH